MSKLRDEIAVRVCLTSEIVYFHQKCPNTFVEVLLLDFCIQVRGFGYAKVNWPDKWNPDEGKRLALAKAYYDITRQILKSDKVDGYLKELGIEK